MRVHLNRPSYVRFTSPSTLAGRILSCAPAFCLCLWLSGCSTLSSDLERASSTIEHNNVAILGFTVRKGVKSDLRLLTLTDTLAREIRRERQLGTVPIVLTRKAIGVKGHDKILKDFAATAGLSKESRLALQRARLGSRYAIIARLEKNETRDIKMVYADDKNQRRDFLQNRVDARVAAQRVVTISAALHDTRSGREIWRQAYKVSATSETRQADFEGESFVGSMVASVTNLLNNGVNSSSGPPAPSLPEAVNAGLVEIARGIPLRGRVDRYRENRVVDRVIVDDVVEEDLAGRALFD